MKKNYKIFISLVLSVLLLFSFSACQNGGGGGYTPPTIDSGDQLFRDDDFLDYPDAPRRDEIAFVDDAPADTGTLKDNYFDFESALYQGSSNQRDHKCIGASYQFHTDFSGNVCLKNIAVGAKMTFTFSSDKKVKVPFDIVLSQTGELVKLGDAVTITNNGHKVFDDTVVLPTETTTPGGLNETYFSMMKASSTISLFEGKNRVVVTINQASINLDYINLRTSAALTDYSPKHFGDLTQDVEITKMPTLSDSGSVLLTCHEQQGDEPCDRTITGTLPKLTDNEYTVEDLKDGSNISFKIANEDVSVGKIEEKRHTLTLDKGELASLTFADGKTEGKFFAGSVPELVYELPPKKGLNGWKNLANGEEITPDKVFTMIDASVTIVPVLKDLQEIELSLTGAKFSDGTSKKSVYADSVITGLIVDNIPEGKVHTGWYETSLEQMMIMGEDITVPEIENSSLSLAPLFDGIYATNDTTDGKIKHGYIRANSIVEPDKVKVLEGMKPGPWENSYHGIDTVINNELAKLYGLTAKEGNLPAGSRIFTQNLFNVTPGSSKVTYTIQNKGTQALTLRLYQVNSGTAPTPPACTEVFTLQPGGVTTQFIEFDYQNGNLMYNLVLQDNTGITEMKVAISMYYSKTRA